MFLRKFRYKFLNVFIVYLESLLSDKQEVFIFLWLVKRKKTDKSKVLNYRSESSNIFATLLPVVQK